MLVASFALESEQCKKEESHPYRIFVNRKVGEGIGGNVLAFFFASVNFSLGAPNDNVASLASKSEMYQMSQKRPNYLFSHTFQSARPRIVPRSGGMVK